MATITVSSGGPFSTLDSALSDAGTGANDIISIEGTWTADDSTAATVLDNGIKITADADSRHPGYIVGTGSTSAIHYRLRVSGGGHCLTIDTNIDDVTVENIVLVQASTTVSAEGVRVGTNASNALLKNLILHADTDTDQQDGVYFDDRETMTAENCQASGFGRAGFNNNDSHVTAIMNLNSCVAFNNGTVTTVGYGGGFVGYNNATMNVQNCLGLGQANYGDYDARVTTGANWTIHNSMATDASISSRDSGAVNAYESYTVTESASPGAGTFICVNDVTTGPYDLRLIDSADNDAQDAHATATGAGLTIPSLDCVGTSRPQNTNYDIGAFEVVSGGGGGTTPKGPFKHVFTGPFGGPI